MSEKSRPYCLGALPNINIPDNFDEYLEKGEFDQFFGILNSDKSVSLTDIDNAIKQRGGQLNNF
ncbi:hypothetical protein [Moraxella oculi]|uniref:Uncharacterized protein n=1 Tax=Moraxella oculi TaxID=2940516 RepID=A0ABW8U5G0_9GAMM